MLNKFRTPFKNKEFEIVCIDLLYQKNKGNIYFEKLYLLMNSMYDWEIDNDCVKVIANFLFDIFRNECLMNRKERMSNIRVKTHSVKLACDRFMKLNYNDLYIVIYDNESKGRLFSEKKLIAKCLKKGKEIEYTYKLNSFLTFPGDHNFGLIHMIFQKELMQIEKELIQNFGFF